MPKIHQDVLSAFPLGMNSGVSPLLLPKTQLAMAINATVRGGFAGPRPPFQFQTCNFGGNLHLQTAVENGLFQGAAVYRPDYGTSQIVASFSGRLFAFTPVGGQWTVAEITIAGDPNSATQAQCWMWQAEKWLIISDGSGALPIFYDGVSCRRSLGPEHLLGVATATNPPAGVVPAVGEDIILDLTAAWAHDYGIAVHFNGALYEVNSVAGTVEVTLTNVDDIPGTVIPSGTSIVAKSSISATISRRSPAITGPYFDPTYNYGFAAQFTAFPSLAIGSFVTFSGRPAAEANLWKVWAQGYGAVDSSGVIDNYYQFQIRFPPDLKPPTALPPAVGTLLTQTSAAPDVVVAVTATNCTVPDVGSAVTVPVVSAYTGPAGATVWIGTKQYTIVAVPGIGAASIRMTNLTDTPAGVYTFNADITSVAELPACRMGAYGMGQNWVSLVDGISFACGDLVGSAGGTLAYNYRDAVLKAENYAVMESFRLPGAGEFINSMTFTAVLDTALGQGPLEIGTISRMFSVRVPFDLTDFQGTTLTDAETNPILTESLIGSGPMGHDSTLAANSDTLFRSLDGLGSLKLARRSMSEEWGNVPMSTEVDRAFQNDNDSLLSFSSAVTSKNRLLITCYPVTTAGQGTAHKGLVALNFDLVSSLRGKVPPAYDGLWTGIQPFKVFSGLFGMSLRTFAFAYDPVSTRTVLYELLGTAGDDNGATRIKWVLETPVLFNADKKPLAEIVKLNNGEMYLNEINGIVDVAVYYRPLFHPCWTLWHEFSVCATMTGENAKEQVMMPLGLGEPSGTPCDSVNNRPLREGPAFQFRVEITGRCKFFGMKVEAVESPQPKFAKPANCNVMPQCLQVQCLTDDDFDVYQLQLPAG